MDLYMNTADISDIIGVEEAIISRTLERRDIDLEAYVRVASAPSEEPGVSTKPRIQLRVDGLAPLIKKLTYNIPTDDIIENLSCQIIDITYLRETRDQLAEENEALVAENRQLQERVEALEAEGTEWAAQVNDLTNELTAERSKSWLTRLLGRKD